MNEELLNETEINPEQVYPKMYIGKATPIEEVILLEFLDEFIQNKLDTAEIRLRLLDMANSKGVMSGSGVLTV